MLRTKVSDKGQVVIPKDIREELGLTSGAVLKVCVEGRKVILEPAEEPPVEIFVRAGPPVTEPVLREAKKRSDKAELLLRDIGAEIR